MCWVAIGCLLCKTHCGCDPTINSQDGVQVDKPGISTIIFSITCFIPIAILTVVFYFSASFLFYIFVSIPSLIIFIFIARCGKVYIVIDRHSGSVEELYESKSGFCCMAYRRQKIGSLNVITRIYTKNSSTTKINDEPAVDLYVQVTTSAKPYRLINNGSSGNVYNARKEIQNWWNANDLSKKYNIHFNFGDISSRLLAINQQISLLSHQNNNASILLEQEFKSFVLKIKLKNRKNGKIIDLAFETDKNNMLNEFKMLQDAKKNGTDHISDEKIIELLIDKSDNILKSKNIDTHISDANGNSKNEGENYMAPLYNRIESPD